MLKRKNPFSDSNEQTLSSECTKRLCTPNEKSITSYFNDDFTNSPLSSQQISYDSDLDNKNTLSLGDDLNSQESKEISGFRLILLKKEITEEPKKHLEEQEEEQEEPDMCYKQYEEDFENEEKHFRIVDQYYN